MPAPGLRRQRGIDNASEAEAYPERFCPRCSLRYTADNPIASDVCSWCAADQARGRLLTWADFTM